jgi:superfamily II DNA or RNA helicase
MLVLHGAWVHAAGVYPSRFALWGEQPLFPYVPGAMPGAVGPSRATPPARPLAVSPAETQSALASLNPTLDSGAIEPWPFLMPSTSTYATATAEQTSRLPGARAARTWSGAGATATAVKRDSAAGAQRVEALTFDAVRAVPLLMALPAAFGVSERGHSAGPNPDVAIADDLRFWVGAVHFALDLLARGRVLSGPPGQNGALPARWRPALNDERDARELALMARAMPPAAGALRWELAGGASPPLEPVALLRSFLEAVVDAVAREALGTTGRVESWRVCFRLEPPAATHPELPPTPPELPPQSWTLSYHLQASHDPSLLIPAAEVWRPAVGTRRVLSRLVDDSEDALLAGLGRAADHFRPIAASLGMAAPEACPLTPDEAHDFLGAAAPRLRAAGFGVLVPALASGLGLRLQLDRPESEEARPLSWKAVTWDRLVDYDWQVALGGEQLTPEEFEALAALKQPLVQVRGRWVEMAAEDVQRTLAFVQQQPARGQMALRDALQHALAPDATLGQSSVAVETRGWLESMLRSLHSEAGAAKPLAVDNPPGFTGRLRPYQKTGVAWLAALRRLGMGACLADDMGLGKTVELIALWLHQPPPPGAGVRPALLVCPTSVVGNWRRELERFAPSLRVLIHHGTERNRSAFATAAAQHDVVISTYALLHRDAEVLAGVEWGDVALDEAQNIKNASTKTAQTARRLRARWRVVLSGTPVENHLSDLWSIMDVLNPGYLGSAEEFRKRFAIPIQGRKDPEATARLKALVAPFVLRRVKTDRSIIQDLPEKNEMRVYCSLTPEQATLYQAVLRDAMTTIEASTGITRRGRILSTVTKLKQVCDHPALLLHDGSALPGRSGKLDRLGEMLDEVIAVGDRALVFTQYAEMGRLIKQYCDARFGGEVPFLHGGTPARERDRLVAAFQEHEAGGSPLFVLSIKAGGTGLNLTAANHVFHLDRWWNPAVETQATDRAFRIGQRRDVQVHTLLCAGTFEEAIDSLIERKLALSQAIVGTSEAWLTEMSTAELRELLALNSDAMA